jgi:multidrug efflux pump subunit AcrA (membrane-fusion protein)
MAHCKDEPVMVHTPEPTTINGNSHLSRRKAPARPGWRRPRVLLGGLAVLLVLAVVAAFTTWRSQPVAPPATSAPLVAHGQILPVHQAHVGTQGGGVVQQLNVKVGDRVAEEAPVAWVLGPSGTEIVSAPFGGSVTNVLVHAGDTLAPAAPIAVVADLSSLQVETNDVDEFLVSHVAVGQPVQVTVDALDDEPLRGTVTSVAMLPQMSTTGAASYPVVISLSGVPPDVRAGMSVRLTLPD